MLPSLRPTAVYVSVHERCLLAFCSDCQNFVAAAADIGRIAIAVRAHHCQSLSVRKLPLKVDAAEHWMKASGMLA